MSGRSLSMNHCRVTAHDSRVRFAGARVALLLAGTACSDPSATRACAPRFVGQVQHVPGVPIDLPPEPRPWDTSAAALEEAIAREDGHAVIAFKAPDAARAVDTGWRAAVPAGAIEQGFDLLAAHCVPVVDYYGALGAAHVRMPPGAATMLRRHVLVDYIEPRQWLYLQGSGTGL